MKHVTVKLNLTNKTDIFTHNLAQELAQSLFKQSHAVKIDEGIYDIDGLNNCRFYVTTEEGQKIGHLAVRYDQQVEQITESFKSFLTDKELEVV